MENRSATCAHPDLLEEINALLIEVGISKSAFGQEALRDPRVVFDLEAGREMRKATRESIRSAIVRLREDAAEKTRGDAA